MLLFERFKATKSMTALVQERSRRQKDKAKSSGSGSKEALSSTHAHSGISHQSVIDGDISSLVESIKRKSKLYDGKKHDAKRRKL